MIVGDPNQEIYAFRGSSNRFLLAAGERPDVETFFLPQSFRLTGAVADAANALIAHNPNQPEEKLRLARAGGKLEVVQVVDEDEERRWLAQASR